MKLLAHSAQPKKGLPEQLYQEHMTGVMGNAQLNVEKMLQFDKEKTFSTFKNIVMWAACFHDLGKLDEENQAVLRGEVKAKKLPINHVDAGTSYLKDFKKMVEAAFIVYSHHCGLPSLQFECARGANAFRDTDIKDRTNANLRDFLSLHQKEVASLSDDSKQSIINDGLARRLALSCLVDADHTDSARETKATYNTRWAERLDKLDEYVRRANKEQEKNTRNEMRNEIYFACRNREIDKTVYYCDSPVGTGKTTAIMSHLIQAAIQRRLRHIIVVLPFTNIITQSVKVYREALVLDGEDPESVVAEHHHQADFSSIDSRNLATLWNAPIIVTTAVQFFETLGSNHPSKLRKMHELPGSGIFIDESHSAIPTWLWPQAWLWLKTLTNDWGCHLVLASGTTAKFWEIDDFFKQQDKVPELIPEKLREASFEYERKRIELRVKTDFLNSGVPMSLSSIDELIDFILSQKGPRIVIMNTVHSTAFLANQMKSKGFDVIHLSTALTPADREPIIKEIYERLIIDENTNLPKYQNDWTLVATSCAEAGLNFSFRNGFAELRSIQSYLQISGRVNRDGKYPDSQMWCFSITDPNIKQHSGFKTSQKVFRKIIEGRLINELDITELVTEAIKRELKEDYNEKTEAIQKCERNHQYPEVAELCKIIDSNTRLVVINPEIIRMLECGEKVSSIELLKNSVQIWAPKIGELGLAKVNGYGEIYRWFDGGYDSGFLGYMKAIFEFEALKKTKVLII